MSFDWKTEDFDWDDKPRHASEPNPAADIIFKGIDAVADDPEAELAAGKTRRRPLLFLAIAGILLLAVTGMIFRQVERQAAEGRERAEADVLASHELVRNADASGDTELFVSILSGRDPQWATNITTLAANKALNDRSNFGFRPAQSNDATADQVVTLAPDLRSAELSVRQNYDVAIGSGLTETVTLTQTAVYRLGPDRWLLAPPEPEFWGESVTIDGLYASISFPDRDRSLAQRLSRDLEAIAANLCAALTDGCPPLTIRLSTDPGSLGQASAPRFAGRGGLEIVLPAPSLFGLPVDEAGYRALSRQYAARAVSAIVEEYAGDCCPEDPFFEVLNEALLHWLGLRSWDMPSPAQMESILNDPAPLAKINVMWGKAAASHETVNRQELYALVDFLVEEVPPSSIVEMQRLLADQRSGTMWDWISEITRHRYASPHEFEREWLQHISSRVPMATTGTAELPVQDLHLICQTTGLQDVYLYRYDVRAASLEREHEVSAFDKVMLAPTPNRDGVIIFGHNFNGLNNLPYLWREGEIIPLSFDESEVANLYPLPVQAGDREVIFFDDNGSIAPQFFTLPYDRCAGEASCIAEWIVGSPTFSPDHQNAAFVLGSPTPLTQGPHEPLIYLGDTEAEGLRIIGYGRSPFWIDDNTIGYISNPFRATGQEIVLREATRNEEFLQEIGGSRIVLGELLLTAADLAGLESGAGIHIDRVFRDRQGENLFIFTGGATDLQVPGQMLVYNLENGQLESRLKFNNEPFNSQRAYAFSPDGRWLVVSSRHGTHEKDATTTWSIYIHAADGSVTHEYTLQTDDGWTADWLVDWSSDSQWLAITTGGYVRLVAPDASLSIPLIFENQECAAAVWVNED